MKAREESAALTRLILGIDCFYRDQQPEGDGQLDREGLVPVHWSGLEPERIDSWQQARDTLQSRVAAASTLTDLWARDWLTEQALSLLTLVRWLSGEVSDYEQVVAGAVRVSPEPPTELQVDACRRERDRELKLAGYSSYDEYRDANTVAREDLEAVLEELLAEAEERTRERLPQLALPSERIGVEIVSDVPFTAYCDYPGKRMWISADVPYTRADLKHLVGHEAYPGHYAHMGHRHALLGEGAMLEDSALVVTNTASSVLFEGIAERGPDLLNWRTDSHDRIAWLHNRLQWLCSIEAAHALNTGRRGRDEVAEFLRHSCDGSEAWIDAKISFVTHPLRSPFVYAYWWGGTVVGRWLRRVPVLRLDEAVSHLYGRMHSPITLAAHWNEESH